jgi:hypothetical protein
VFVVVITQTAGYDDNRNNNNKAVPWLRRLVIGLSQGRPGFDYRLGHVEFVVAKVALGADFSDYFGFPCQLSFQQLLHNSLTIRSSTLHTLYTDSVVK